MQEQEKKSTEKNWFERHGVLSVVLALLFVAIVVSTMGSRKADNSVSTPDATTTEVPAVEPDKPKQTKPYTSFGDGLYEVNVDIKPGLYKSEGGESCYHARLSSFNTSDIISNDIAKGPTSVEIMATDKAFKSDGCATWSLVS